MEYSNTGAMRSPFSPRVRQSIQGRRAIGLPTDKKKQSKFMQRPESQGEVIYKTPNCTVETFGLPLPVLVTEVLSFASGELSVRLSSCGWCWLVTGRRILAWPREHLATSNIASPAPAGPAAARELMLPQTDLSHKADLVVLFYEDGAQMPSCIGVSPEGTVRYWPSVGQESVYVEVSCELQGQECEWLGERTEEGLLLATTTCTIVVLNPANIDGRATVTCRTLRPPSGWLGGIGRRVSLLFFGSMPAHVDSKLVGVVVLPGGGAGAGGAGGGRLVVWLGAGLALRAARGDTLYHHALHQPVLNKIAAYTPHGDMNGLEITALDVKANGNTGILLLLATMNVARSPEIRYAIAWICMSDPSRPTVGGARLLGASLPGAGLSGAGLSGAGLSGASVSGAGLPGASLPGRGARLLPLGSGLPGRAVLYSPHYIAVLSGSLSNDKVEYIDVTGSGDSILGAEVCGGVPLFLSRRHGVLALAAGAADNSLAADSLCESPMGSPCPSDMYEGNLSLYEIDPHEISLVTTDACGKLKTAFVMYVRREVAASRALVEELFPPVTSPEPDVDSALDRTVVNIAREMIDDIPNGDPRWKQRPGGPHTNIALGSSAALQIAAHLRDKQTAFSLFMDFLRSTGLWQRLGLLSRETGGGCISTVSVLASVAEQLAIAIALRRLQQGNDAQLIDAAIYQVICSENAELEEEPEIESALSSGALSPSDVCYRRVSGAGRVLRALCGPQPPADIVPAVCLIAEVMRDVYKCRSQWQSLSVPPELGPKALLPALVDLQKQAIAGARNCQDASLRAQLYSSAARLADLELGEALNLQRSSHTAHLYHTMRRQAILPFIEDGQTERAAALAEKFKDFELLIEMCVKNDDLDRLYHYIDKYINEGIAEIAFAWLADQGGAQSAKLIRSVGARYPAALGEWLQRCSPRRPLLALQRLRAGEPGPAARPLLAMAARETHSVTRLATMASLAKLCLIVADEDKSNEIWSKVESCLALSEQHAALPRDIRIHYGLDSEDSRVIPVDELVQMYIDSESKALTEYDYKKALDLTDFVQDMERRDDLRLRIWCTCIRRDDWSTCRVDAPSDEMQNKMFFRLIDLVHIMGGDLELLLPPVEDIMTAPELAELVSDPRFHFIIKYGYECLDTTRNNDMET